MNQSLIFKRQALLGTALLALTFWGPGTARAVIFATTDDPAQNTTEPTGELAGSGWQYQGRWLGFLGTVVSPRHFITAKHVGGSVGGGFVFQGETYTTVGVVNNGSDLNVWEVAGTFPHYAPLAQTASPTGQPVVIFGRGTRRGAEVIVNDQLKGWTWGAADGVLRWGENVVAGKQGSLLKFNFDRAGGPNEVHLSSGDSGGGIFVNDAGTWKLAAIAYAVEGPWKYTSTGVTFNAALVDKGGLYRSSTLNPDNEADSPSAFYATPVAPHLDWLLSVLDLPQPPAPPAPKGVQLVVSPPSEGESEPDMSVRFESLIETEISAAIIKVGQPDRLKSLLAPQPGR